MAVPRALAPLLALTLIGCGGDSPTSPAVVSGVQTPTTTTILGCPGLGDGCTPVETTLAVSSVNVGGGYFTSGGNRYYASFGTVFHPIAFPTDPVIPNDPVYPSLRAWNALVAEGANFRAFLGQIRTLPPNPVFPNDPIRYRVDALFDGTDYFLITVTPVLVN